ncbi:hypothetical protein GCM10028786_20090 [Flaviaesturariibacter terrae]
MIYKSLTVTYFAQNLKHLRKRSAKTQEQLGQELRLGRTTIANYESGFSSPTDPDVLVRLGALFSVSIDELLTRDLSQAFAALSVPTMQRVPTGGADASEPRTEMRVPAVSRAEAANYANLSGESTYVAGLPTWGLPLPDTGTYRLFEVADNALAPRFTAGDWALCRRLESLEELRDGAACFLLCPGHGLLLRRVLNQLPGMVHLLVDAVSIAGSGPAALPPTAITEAWEVEWSGSRQLDAPLSQVYGKIAELEQQVRALSSRLSTS